MNWTVLNKKVLKLIRCEVSDEEIESFASRRSSSMAIDFLRLLKVRLLAYEPLYLSGQYAVDPVSQARLTAQLSTTQTRPTNRDHDLPPPPPPFTASAVAPPPFTSSSASMTSSARKPSMALSSGSQPLSPSSTAQFTSTSAMTSTGSESGGAARRPSMMKSQQLLKKYVLRTSPCPPPPHSFSLLVDKPHKKKPLVVPPPCESLYFSFPDPAPLSPPGRRLRWTSSTRSTHPN
jgi:hypothetical protein